GSSGRRRIVRWRNKPPRQLAGRLRAGIAHQHELDAGQQAEQRNGFHGWLNVPHPALAGKVEEATRSLCPFGLRPTGMMSPKKKILLFSFSFATPTAMQTVNQRVACPVQWRIFPAHTQASVVARRMENGGAQLNSRG